MTRQRGTLNGGWNGSQEANDGVSVANMATTDAINILDAVEVPVVVLRRDFTISYFNKAGADMLGLSPSDIGRASRDISVLDALPLLEEHCSHVINGEVESRVDFRDGNKWFVVRISPNTQGNRQVIGTVLTFTNVTAFRASTDQAIYERECTKAILNTVVDPLVVLSADFRIQTGNCAFYTMFGVSRDDTQGIPLYELGHGVFELAPLREHFKKMLAVSPAFQPVEVDHVLTVKGQRAFILDAHPLSFPGHSERRVLMTFQDITVIKQAETVLRELNDTLEKQVRVRTEELSLIIETIPGLVWCAAPDGELNYLNRRILDYTGTSPDTFAQLGWTSFLHPDDVEPTVSAWSRAVATGQPYDTQCRLRRSDGIYRWFQVLGQAARDNKGGVTRWYGLLIDIDDRKNMEEALRSSESRLSRATRTATLGEFAASIAHEINQPLAAVVANGHACLRWLSAQPPGMAKAQEAAERIVRDGTEAGEVIRRIRALFKHAPLDKTDLDLNDVIAEVLRLLSGERTKKHVSVETDLDKDLSLVAGDRVQLQQVVFNLLLNGIEAMDSISDRPKKLFIRSKRHSPETVLIEIRDSGVGLKDSEKVFEAFFTTKENGMGMGLAVCRAIIDAHHGRLWAASGEGAGTTFSFTLPAAAVPATSLPAAS
jgi:PAS domain S-box-containing protein